VLGVVFQVSIAGRRLETGEIVESEVIHLQDFTANTTTGHMQGSRGTATLLGCCCCGM
jgi:hypothetical protein